MSLVDLIMPKLGESITEATILKWLKKPGDHVAEDETVLEIATDKVDSEVPSTTEGILEEILYNENDVVPIGKVIARIKADKPAEIVTAESFGSSPLYEEAKLADEVPYQPMAKPNTSNGAGIRFYSPLVLNIAASEGVAMSELERIPGTGQDGRVSKKDILEFIASRKNIGQIQQTVSRDQPQPTQAIMISEGQKPEPRQLQQITAYGGNVEVIEMDRMRKMIARHMVESKNVSAHVTSFAECDVTTMVLWREKMKHEFEKRDGEKITFTPPFY